MVGDLGLGQPRSATEIGEAFLVDLVGGFHDQLVALTDDMFTRDDDTEVSGARTLAGLAVTKTDQADDVLVVAYSFGLVGR